MGTDYGAIDSMKDAASGATCRPCLLSGVPQTFNRDGSKLGEDDRCAGCGETICSRHPKISQGTVGERHSARAHGAPMVSA